MGFCISAQERLFFTTLTTRDGLPNASVSIIVQDKQGFLWFGTQNGLARYDGYTFKVYENEAFLDNVLSHNQVQTLFLDDDILWIGIYGGLNRLELKTDTITSYKHEENNDYSISSNLIVSICRDSKGSLLIGTSVGLDHFDEVSGNFYHYIQPNNAQGLPSCMIRDIHCDKEGELWIATSGQGLWKYDYVSDSFSIVSSGISSKSSLSFQYVMSISEDSKGTLWFGTWFGGISRLIDRSTYQFETIKLDDKRVYFVYAQVEGKILAGTWGGGLFLYDTEAKTVSRYITTDELCPFPNNVAYSAYLDINDVLWIGTNGGGVAHTQKQDIQYVMYEAHDRKPGSLPLGRVTAIAEDATGSLWVAVV